VRQREQKRGVRGGRRQRRGKWQREEEEIRELFQEERQ